MLYALLLAAAQALHIGWERHQQDLAMQEWERLFGAD